MAHLPDFIVDLAIILITAGIATVVFKWLKQPVVLGYIVAGFIAGPFITWLPTVTEMGNVEIWAEIGVIFLLFALGLEFSFKKLVDVGGTASIATLINLGSMIIIGYVAGQFLGWSQMDSIFLGGMLSMSSTTIIIKAFNDMGLQKQKFAGIVFGMLIVEDLAAILMMVLLSTLAASNRIEGAELLNSVLKLGFFIFIWFVVGIYLIPTILKKLKKYLNDETLLIISAGLCLGMVLFASKVGFSAALGAFIMGSILAETIKAKKIEHVMEPVKNLFGAVFFVSVGMMLDPYVLYDYAWLILVLTVVVLVGRVIFATLGVLAAGNGLKVSLQAGFSLAQIGEFSFIIATLGMSLGVISDFLYPIIVTVSIITTFTTPYFIKLSIPVYNYLEKHIPSGWTKLIDGYASSDYKPVNMQNDWNKLLRSVLQNVIIYTILAIAVIILCEQLIEPFIEQHIGGAWGRLVIAVVALFMMAPFLRAIVMKRNKSPEFRHLWNDSHFNRGVLISMLFLRVCICVGLVLAVLIPLFPKATIWAFIVALPVVVITVFFKGFHKQGVRIEERFLENLREKQVLETENAALHPEVTHDLLSKQIHIEEIEVSPLSPRIGKSLKESNFRQATGVNLVTIIRGNRKINIPDANERIYPYDKLIVAGSDEDIQRFITSIEERNQALADDAEPQHHVRLSQYIIEEGSPMTGKSIQELSIQEKTECMIIGIDRGEHSVLRITPQFTFERGDVLLLAGETAKLKAFEENLCRGEEIDSKMLQNG
ncbi:MAG: cation:proton antiporter [Tannerellaceae bacterium]|nr:cation:proton antiporter [Tannerellaceae bacterium]